MRIAGAVTLALALAWGLAMAAGASWRPEGVPTFDAADYLEQALTFRDGLRARDGAKVIAQALAPDVHPPLHALALGVWLLASGGGLPMAMAAELAVFAAGLGALVWLGQRVDPGRGGWAGAAAAALVAFSGQHQRLAAAPMTENLAMLLSIAAVGLMFRGPPLAAGFAVLAAGLVRFNLLPMLLLPALAWAAWQRRRDAWGWVLPPVLAFAAWRAARPELGDALTTFFTNVDSGVPTWSRENLTWVPRVLVKDVWGPAATALVVGAFVSGLRGAAPGERLVQAVALVGMAALTLHPYKLERGLHGTVPFLALAATLAVARVAREGRGVALAGAALAAALGLRLLFPPLPGRLEVGDSPELRAALDDLVARTSGRERLVFVGSHPLVSRHAVSLWHHLAGSRVVVTDEPAPHPDCRGDLVPAGLDCTPKLAAEGLGSATVLVVERLGEARRRKAGAPDATWGPETARRVAELASARGVPGEVLEYPRMKARVTLYGATPPPSAP